MPNQKISQLTGATTPLGGTEELPIVQSSTTKKVSVANLTNGRLVNAAALQTSGTPAGGFAASKWLIQTEDTTATRAYACGPDTSTFGTLEFYLAKSNGGPQLGVGMFSTYSVLRAAGVGGIKVDTSGNVSAEAGNFKFDIAGKGIDFSANTHAAGMTSELLTWYEEGTFTPTLLSGGAQVNRTYSVQYGRYTRIGNRVFYHLYITLTAKGTSTGNTTIGGLPFTSNGSDNDAIQTSADANVTYTGSVTPYIGNGTTVMNIYASASATALTFLTDTALANNSSFWVTGQYKV